MARYQGLMLVHLAIGDAYGAGFEYVEPALVARHNRLDGYFQHPRHSSIRPGQYTDDTQMSLAVAEALLESNQPTDLQWAEHFLESFHRDRREGYAGRFYDFLLSVSQARDFLARIKPNSAKSGAAMRALPVGLLADAEQVLALTADQARITHDTPDGIRAAQAVALTSHYFLYRQGPRLQLGEYLSERLGGNWTDWRGKVGAPGLESARAALTALSGEVSMGGLLRRCIDYTGDVDTVASIALGAAACCPEYSRDLPGVLYEQLENGRYGRDYLVALQARLVKRFPGTTLD